MVPGAAGRQHGFVLVLSLVLLAVMTLIAVASMNSANIELKAAANSRHHQVAFNAVQALLDFSISDEGVGLLNFQTTSATTQTISLDDAAGFGASNYDASDVNATMDYAGCSIGIGSSLEEGKGFSYNFFDMRASGSNSTGTASSVQGQGIRFPAAAC